MNNGLAWELEWIDQHPECYEGPLHREAVKRNITARYLMNRLIQGEVFYKPVPETRYQYLGLSLGAGSRREERLFVYWNAETNQLHHRDRDDYKMRMERCK